MSICPVFTGKREQRGYKIDEWYQKQIKDRIANQPNTTKQQNWNWFKHTTYWKESTFHEYYRQIKANKPTKYKKLKAPPISYDKHKEIAHKV